MSEELRLLQNVWQEVFKAAILLSPTFIVSAGIALILSFVPNRNKRFFLLYFGFALFGGTIGVFIGASKQSVIVSVLPPLITLISGYVLFTKSNALSLKSRYALGGGVVAFIVMLLVCAFYMRGFVSPPDAVSDRPAESTTPEPEENPKCGCCHVHITH